MKFQGFACQEVRALSEGNDSGKTSIIYIAVTILAHDAATAIAAPVPVRTNADWFMCRASVAYCQHLGGCQHSSRRVLTFSGNPLAFAHILSCSLHLHTLLLACLPPNFILRPKAWIIDRNIHITSLIQHMLVKTIWSQDSSGQIMNFR